MSKKKKEKPFDNSISKVTEPLRCPDCHNPLQFMYARKRTEDEAWLCPTCETIFAITIKIIYEIDILKSLCDE